MTWKCHRLPPVPSVKEKKKVMMILGYTAGHLWVKSVEKIPLKVMPVFSVAVFKMNLPPYLYFQVETFVIA